MAETTLHNESELLTRISNGEETAFKIVFEFYWPIIYTNVLQLTKDQELSRDLTQELFYKIWMNRTRLTEIRSFKSYLFTIAKNLVIDAFRKQVFISENLPYLKDFFIDNAELPDRILEVKELDKHIRMAIAALPSQVQQAFLLKRNEGLTHEQIAIKLGISSISSRNYITRAVNAIREYLNQHQEATLLIILAIICGT